MKSRDISAKIYPETTTNALVQGDVYHVVDYTGKDEKVVSELLVGDASSARKVAELMGFKLSGNIALEKAMIDIEGIDCKKVLALEKEKKKIARCK